MVEEPIPTNEKNEKQPHERKILIGVLSALVVVIVGLVVAIAGVSTGWFGLSGGIDLDDESAELTWKEKSIAISDEATRILEERSEEAVQEYFQMLMDRVAAGDIDYFDSKSEQEYRLAFVETEFWSGIGRYDLAVKPYLGLDMEEYSDPDKYAIYHTLWLYYNLLGDVEAAQEYLNLTGQIPEESRGESG